MTMTGYGAISDANMIDGGAMTAGQPTLTVASGPFTAGDVGKTIIVADAGTAGVKLKTTISAYVSATQVTLATNAAATVSGSGVAWGTDASAALQAAINAADTARGGTIMVDGYFLITEPVTKAFFANVTASHVRLLGTGTDSAIINGVDETETLLTLSSVALDLDAITFVGLPDATDSKRLFDFNGVYLKMERCQFMGLLTVDQPIRLTACRADLRRNVFGGTFLLTDGVGGVSRSVIYNTDWHAFADQSSEFVDYGYWRGMQLGKSGSAAVQAWVGFGSPNASFASAALRTATIASFRDTRLDEGSYRGIWAEPASGTISAVELVGTGQNVSAAGESAGIYCRDVDNVLVDRCAFGLATDPGTAFGRFVECGRVEINDVTLLQGVDKIVATNVGRLVVRDTTIANYSLAGTGFYPEPGLVKAGAVTDADYPYPPAVGVQAFDRINGRLYTRASGDWVYFDIDGGSLLGPELVPNGTGDSTTGWDASNATLSSASGKLRATVTGYPVRVRDSFVVTSGQTYRWAVDITNGTAPGIVRFGASTDSSSYVQTSVSGSGTFVATSGTVHITLIANSETVGSYADFDNISVKAA